MPFDAAALCHMPPARLRCAMPLPLLPLFSPLRAIFHDVFDYMPLRHDDTPRDFTRHALPPFFADTLPLCF